MRPTSCKEAVFREYGDGVEEQNHDCADRLATANTVIWREGKYQGNYHR
jgi:hypothetical protein